MSITASSRPTRERTAREKVCPRCGIDFEDNGLKWAPGAPCRDCRSWLVKEEGHDMDEWRRKPLRPKAAAA